MKKMAVKRLTALVLALIMTLSLLPVSAWATETTTYAQLYMLKDDYVTEHQCHFDYLTNGVDYLNLYVDSDAGKVQIDNTYTITTSNNIGTFAFDGNNKTVVWTPTSAVDTEGYLEVAKDNTVYRMKLGIINGSNVFTYHGVDFYTTYDDTALSYGDWSYSDLSLTINGGNGISAVVPYAEGATSVDLYFKPAEGYTLELPEHRAEYSSLSAADANNVYTLTMNDLERNTSVFVYEEATFVGEVDILFSARDNSGGSGEDSGDTPFTLNGIEIYTNRNQGVVFYNDWNNYDGLSIIKAGPDDGEKHDAVRVPYTPGHTKRLFFKAAAGDITLTGIGTGCMFENYATLGSKEEGSGVYELILSDTVTGGGNVWICLSNGSGLDIIFEPESNGGSGSTETEYPLYVNMGDEATPDYQTTFRGDINAANPYGLWLFINGENDTMANVTGDYKTSVKGNVGSFYFEEGAGFKWNTTGATDSEGYLEVRHDNVSNTVYRMKVTLNTGRNAFTHQKVDVYTSYEEGMLGYHEKDHADVNLGINGGGGASVFVSCANDVTSASVYLVPASGLSLVLPDHSKENSTLSEKDANGVYELNVTNINWNIPVMVFNGDSKVGEIDIMFSKEGNSGSGGNGNKLFVAVGEGENITFVDTFQGDPNTNAANKMNLFVQQGGQMVAIDASCTFRTCGNIGSFGYVPPLNGIGWNPFGATDSMGYLEVVKDGVVYRMKVTLDTDRSVFTYQNVDFYTDYDGTTLGYGLWEYTDLDLTINGGGGISAIVPVSKDADIVAYLKPADGLVLAMSDWHKQYGDLSVADANGVYTLTMNVPDSSALIYVFDASNMTSPIGEIDVGFARHDKTITYITNSGNSKLTLTLFAGVDKIVEFPASLTENDELILTVKSNDPDAWRYMMERGDDQFWIPYTADAINAPDGATGDPRVTTLDTQQELKDAYNVLVGEIERQGDGAFLGYNEWAPYRTNSAVYAWASEPQEGVITILPTTSTSTRVWCWRYADGLSEPVDQLDGFTIRVVSEVGNLIKFDKVPTYSAVPAERIALIDHTNLDAVISFDEYNASTEEFAYATGKDGVLTYSYKGTVPTTGFVSAGIDETVVDAAKMDGYTPDDWGWIYYDLLTIKAPDGGYVAKTVVNGQDVRYYSNNETKINIQYFWEGIDTEATYTVTWCKGSGAAYEEIVEQITIVTPTVDGTEPWMAHAMENGVEYQATPVETERVVYTSLDNVKGVAKHEYSEQTGKLFTTFDNDAILDVASVLKATFAVKAPEGAVSYKAVLGGDGRSNPTYNYQTSSHAEHTWEMLLDQEQRVAENGLTVAPGIDALNQQVVGEIEYYYSADVWTRYMLIRWELDDGSAKYEYLQLDTSNYFCQWETPAVDNVEDITTPVDKPTVAFDGNIKLVSRIHPQNKSGHFFFELDVVDENGNAYVVEEDDKFIIVLPYEFMGVDQNGNPWTYETARKMKSAKIQHFDDDFTLKDNNGTLHGTFTERGIEFEVDSFSPFMLVMDEHVHEYTYTASEAVITESCTCGHSETATVTAPTGTLVYDGTAKEATVSYSADWVATKDLTVSYSSNGNVNAGTVTAVITKGSVSATTTYGIERKAVTVTADAKSMVYGAAESVLTYVAEGLVTGETLAGELIRTAGTNAGTYAITQGTVTDENNPNYAITFIGASFVITKATPSVIAPTGLTATYGDILSDVKLPTGWDWKDAATTSVGNAGNNTFIAVYMHTDTDNYNTVEEQVTVAVAKQQIAKPDADTETFTYTGEEQTYSVLDSNLYTISNNKRTAAGEQTVTVALDDTANFEWADGTTADLQYTFTIAKADQTAPVVSKVDETISKKADGVIADVNSTMEYSADGTAYTAISGDKVENLAAGTYYVRVKGDANHNPSPDTEVVIGAGRKLTVTFIADGATVDTVYVDYGADATAPEIPAKDGYTQTAPAWDKDGKNIVSDTEITAVYTVNKYTVTYVADGKTVDTQTVEHGKNAVEPAVPAKSGYTGVWGKDGKNITADTEIAAVYTAYTYPGHYPTVTPDKPAETPAETPATTPVAPPAEVTVPVSGDENTINVAASVSGTKATLDTVDLAKLEGVIGDDVDTGVVTVDFSVLDKPVDTVELPAEVVKEIADAVNDPNNDAESLEIVLNEGMSIEFDAKALANKAAQADGLDITISMKHTSDDVLSAAQQQTIGGCVAFDINVTSGGEHISDMGGKVTVHAPYELRDGEKAEGIVVFYVDDDGNKERCETSYDSAKKRVNWKTDHFSVYMIAYEAPVDDAPVVDDTPPADDAQDGNNAAAPGVGLWIGILLVVLVAAIVVVAILIKRKRA